MRDWLALALWRPRATRLCGLKSSVLREPDGVQRATRGPTMRASRISRPGRRAPLTAGVRRPLTHGLARSGLPGYHPTFASLSSESPNQYSVPLPPLQAHSHSASLGALTGNLDFFVSQAQ